MSASPILATRNLGLDIGGATIVADVSLEVLEGELLGVIGPNGAGKTTLFNLLSGLCRPTTGTIELAGADVTGEPPLPPYAGGARPDVPGLERLPAAVRPRERASRRPRPRWRDDADLAARDRRARARRAGDVGDRPGRARVTRDSAPAGSLAHGDKRQLELAMLLAADPQVILLDEPMAGVSVENVPELVELIRSVHAQEGKTVLMVEHHMEVVTASRTGSRSCTTARCSPSTRPTRSWRTRRCSRRTSGRSSVAPPRSRVSDLHVHLGESHVLQGISFDVPEGGVTALLGRNGVGKTTTLRALLGLVAAARHGRARRATTSRTLHAPDRPARRRLRPRGPRRLRDLTVDENLRLAERDGEPRYDLVYELFPELRSAARSAPGRSRAGSSRCSRSGGRS